MPRDSCGHVRLLLRIFAVLELFKKLSDDFVFCSDMSFVKIDISR